MAITSKPGYPIHVLHAGIPLGISRNVSLNDKIQVVRNNEVIFEGTQDAVNTFIQEYIANRAKM